MRILLMGDSLTEGARARKPEREGNGEFVKQYGEQYPYLYGTGYAFYLQGVLSTKYPKEHIVFNRGIGGNRIVDLYSRIKVDCWNLKPDVMSILVGVNDVWLDMINNGVELDRYERLFRMYLDDIKKGLPNVDIMLIEPYILKGYATNSRFDDFQIVMEYAKVVKKLADEYGYTFIPLQKTFDEWAEKYGDNYVSYDGVHPAATGAKLIADAWLNAFEKKYYR